MVLLRRWLSATGLCFCFLCVFQVQADADPWAYASGKGQVKLDVPLVKQGKALCGPATIEMLFRYWGVNEYDQYDIAYNILLQFADTKRFKKSGILGDPLIDWRK